MSKNLKFNLNPGVTLHVGQSEVALRFNFSERRFRKYIRAKTKLLPEEGNKHGTVDATAQGLPLPRWLLRFLISILKERVVGAVEDEEPSS
jgi:hypothetical protein